MKSTKLLVLLTCIILSILPFYWLSPGELEMGGDSNRLFLYDPDSYLRASSLYSVEPDGYGQVRPDQVLLPFLFILKLINFYIRSPYILMSLLNSLKLVGSFFFIYLTIREILKNRREKSSDTLIDMAGIVAGLFYTFAPSVGGNMHAALLTHNQVFLNPLVFYLMLRFLLSNKDIYILILLLVTLIFSPNFSLKAPPPPFAFYPLSIMFLIFYIKFFLKKSLPLKKIFFGMILFLGLHAFHTIPVLVYSFDTGSYFNTRLLDATAQQNESLNYFNAVLGLGKVSKNIFYTYSLPELRWMTFAVPFIIILGLLLCKKIHKDLVLIASFFFLTLFLTSANITNIGVELYRKLFYIPGFGMFRVFYGQWQWVYSFFYSILFGYLLCIVFSKLRIKNVIILSVVLVTLFVFSSWTFISGNILKTIHWGSNNMTSIIKMNPDYEQTLGFLKTLPDDGKIINFPFTDYGYQLVAGINSGAYIGVSPTAYLTGKRDFSGYQNISPFAGTFLELIKNKKYHDIQRLLSLLNIKYIFYSSDPKAYKEFFPEFPYSLFLQAIPDSQLLSDFVQVIGNKKIFNRGFYSIYKVDIASYLPHFYIPTSIYSYNNQDNAKGENASFFLDKQEIDPRVAFVERNTCRKVFTEKECIQNALLDAGDMPVITYKRINPVKYKVEVSGARKPFTLVFSDKFHNDWKLYMSNKKVESLPVGESYFNNSINESNHDDIFLNNKTFETISMKSLSEDRHFTVNGYANAWYIKPTDVSEENHYEIIIEMTQQRIFYYSLGISMLSVCVFFGYGLTLIKKKFSSVRLYKG